LDDKGDLLERLGKYNEAMKMYDKAIEINPPDPLIRYKKGDLSKQIK
jgi:tetratricopeptide (TPR) repeat protein